MSALIVIFVLGIWGALLYNFGYYASFAVQRKWIRQLTGVVVAASLFTLPVMDEILGAREFENLCVSARTFQIPAEAEGKKFNAQFNRTVDVAVQGKWRPTWQYASTYVDELTGKTIATGFGYGTSGGWFVRKLGNPTTGGDGPLIGRRFCYPSHYGDQVKRLRAMINFDVK